MATSRAVVLTFNKLKYFRDVKNGISKFSSSSSVLNTSSFNPGICITHNQPIGLLKIVCCYVGYTRDPGEVFFKEDVQTLLDRLTGRDYEKVFHNRKLGQRLEPPKYELLTEQELNKVMAEMEMKLKTKLQMPPLVKERDQINNILSRNPEIQGFDNSKYVFIDISQGVSDRVSILF